MTDKEDKSGDSAAVVGRIIALELIIRQLVEASDLREEIFRDCFRDLDRLDGDPDAGTVQAALNAARAHLEQMQGPD